MQGIFFQVPSQKTFFCQEVRNACIGFIGVHFLNAFPVYLSRKKHANHKTQQPHTGFTKPAVFLTMHPLPYFCFSTVMPMPNAARVLHSMARSVFKSVRKRTVGVRFRNRRKMAEWLMSDFAISDFSYSEFIIVSGRFIFTFITISTFLTFATFITLLRFLQKRFCGSPHRRKIAKEYNMVTTRNNGKLCIAYCPSALYNILC